MPNEQPFKNEIGNKEQEFAHTSNTNGFFGKKRHLYF